MNPLTLKIEAPEIVNSALNPLASGIGNTLKSLWDITFGWIDFVDEKIQAKRLYNLNAFKEVLQKNINEIPSDKLTEPSLSIIGPAIEASKYYFEDESLRNMFAKLISNSMNIDTKQIVQTSFVEIIKQLSPVDAKLLLKIASAGIYPVVRLKRPAPPESQGFLNILPLVYLDDTHDEAQINDCAIALTNLERLGIISIRLDEYLTEEHSYDIYKHSPISKYTSDNGEILDYKMERGNITLTPYGISFATVCL